VPLLRTRRQRAEMDSLHVILSWLAQDFWGMKPLAKRPITPHRKDHKISKAT